MYITLENVDRMTDSDRCWYRGSVFPMKGFRKADTAADRTTRELLDT
jgi:hypothetical protein